MPDRSSFAIDFFSTCSLGFDRLAGEAQSVLREAVVDSQADNGLFCGRSSTGDLYYTFFGLLLAAISGAKINIDKCGKAIAGIDFNSLDLVHGCTWLRVNNLLKLLALPNFMRNQAVKFISPKADKFTRAMIEHLAALPCEAFPQSDSSSPYSRFLLNSLYTDFGMTNPASDLSTYRLESGLYSNLKSDADYGLNATCSALFVIPDSEATQTAQALHELQQEDGSFKAVENAPCGDLLSTGTAFFALNKYDLQPRLSVKPFLRTCFRDCGLFAATSDDPEGDLEYTVYALLALGGSV